MERFHYGDLAELKKRASELNAYLPFAEDTGILKTGIRIGDHILCNRLGTAPMEGADSLPDGSPSELTFRRYIRNAEGGSAVIWSEAISIVPEGRSGSTQLLINDENLDRYKLFCERIKEAGLKKNGYAPFLVMQANHSGRYSNPGNVPSPVIAYRNPVYEEFRAADDSCIASDDYLMQLEERFGESALLAKKVGFDAVDIKACHGYLLMELLSAYERPGRYGGSLENRSRLLMNGIGAAKAYEDSDFMVTCRLGIYDGARYPFGFGVSKDGSLDPDLTEPKELVSRLSREQGIGFICLTMGNPYVTTHVTRPFDKGKYEPDEHPLTGVSRMITGFAEIKKAVPEMIIYGSGPSYLRQYADLCTAGAVQEGMIDGMLFGRLSFADPDFANEIITQGRIAGDNVCITCGGCGDLIRAHKPTGCVIRDRDVYGGYMKEFALEKKDLPKNYRG